MKITDVKNKAYRKFLKQDASAPLFYEVVVFLGLLLPLVLFTSVHAGMMPSSALVAAGVSELVGAFILRYLILKVGISAPVA